MKIGIIAETYHCVGTCVTAFDANGRCIVPELPWSNLADFEIADGQAEHLSKREFHQYVPSDPHVEEEIKDHDVEYLQADGVYMIYDVDANRHYYFA
jgi:hypothetical protein